MSNKLITFVTIFFLAMFSFLALRSAHFSVIAHDDDEEEEVDECNETFNYTKHEDFNDNRVNINFESSDYQIDVSADAGYAITEVALEVENDDHSGYWVYATGPVDNFNPNPGGEIKNAKVTVKKVCEEVRDVCNNIAEVQATVPEGYYSNEGACYEKTPVCAEDSYDNFGGEDHNFNQETEVANNELCSNDPVDVCPNIEGNQESLPQGYHYGTIGEIRGCVKDETPTPTSPSCSGDQHLDASGQKCVSFELGGAPAPAPATGGQVLGATTMAGTGSTEENLITMAFVLGAISLGLGTIKNASKKA